MINIVGTLFENSMDHTLGYADQILDKEYEWNGSIGLKQDVINRIVKNRLDTISFTEDSSKGYYQDLDSLIEAVPNPSKGDWAVIPVDDIPTIFVYQNGQWVQTGEQYAFDTSLLNNYLTRKEAETIYQLKLISGENISTINGNNLLKGGNIQINTDTSDFQYKINDLKALINNLEEEIQTLKGQTSSGPVISDGIKHIILEEAQYNALTEYENNAIYFVLESKTIGWELGNELPIILR